MVAPTASGASRPTAAARALASAIEAGPAGPWWSASVATPVLMMSVPDTAQTAATVIVAHSGCSAQKPRTPAQIPASPTHVTVWRPNRRTSHGANAPPSIPPSANAVPCSPATPRLVCCSTRSSGTTGPKP